MDVRLTLETAKKQIRQREAVHEQERMLKEATAILTPFAFNARQIQIPGTQAGSTIAAKKTNAMTMHMVLEATHSPNHNTPSPEGSTATAAETDILATNALHTRCAVPQVPVLRTLQYAVSPENSVHPPRWRHH